MSRFSLYTLGVFFLLISLNSHGQQINQSFSNKKDTVKQKYIPKKLDVIYTEPVDNTDQVPFGVGEDEDEGTESEEDILYAGFDTNAIHYPKFDFSDKKDTTILALINKRLGRFYVPPVKGIVTSDFGPRRRRYHYGIDLDLNTGDPVVAAFDGIVRIAKLNRTYGNLVVIRHENGLETFYAHLSAIEVIPEQKVKAGDLIGLGGNTGRSRGSHLHFETRYLGAAIDPSDIIDFGNYRLLNDTLFLTKDNFQHHLKYKGKESQYLMAYKGKVAKKGNKVKSYKIKKGDTLSEIARKNKTTVKALCKLNKISPNKKITAGKTLKIQ